MENGRTGAASYRYEIKRQYHLFSKTNKAIADAILQEPTLVLSLSSLELAERLNVSVASLIRFCKMIGYNGLRDLKLDIARNPFATSRDQYPSYQINREDSLDSIPGKIVSGLQNALRESFDLFDLEEYRKAVELIHKADTIFLYGVATSATVADDFMNRFIRLGKKCFVYVDEHLQITSAATVHAGDLVIGISHSGQTRSTVMALRIAKEAGASTICISNFNATEIIKYADVQLLTAWFETDFYSERMISRILQLIITDSLFMGVLNSDYDHYSFIVKQVNDALYPHVLMEKTPT